MSMLDISHCLFYVTILYMTSKKIYVNICKLGRVSIPKTSVWLSDLIPYFGIDIKSAEQNFAVWPDDRQFWQLNRI